MKIWLKYFIGIVLGVTFALVAGAENTLFVQAVDFLSKAAIQFGRYALYPAVFFGFTLSIFELRENRSLLKVAIITSLIICGAALLLSCIGLISVLIHTPARIPIFVEGISDVQVLGVKESLLQLLPSSSFEALINGTYILPLCIFGGFAGAGCAVDRNIAKPTITLIDSLARISYAVLVFFVDMLVFGMVAVSSYWVIKFHEMLLTAVFADFAILLIVDLLIIALVIYPALLKIFCRDINPYRVLYASLAPMMAAFFSQDTHVALSVLLRHSNESLGVRRRISSVALPVFSNFGRAGSALVITVSFVVILKSYSINVFRIAFSDIFWLVGYASLFSCLLGRFSIGGTYIALTSLCMLYGRGFESGYLILRPAAFFISSIAAAINALTAITGTYITAYRFNMTGRKDLRFFI
ncbi:dicarboxylate/amino acid:cation symporter [Treponema vincentii]|uniref:Dicarboxylate/amino acid:cation symporter n=1 Tax=Treponema vincentii TaxID=69710 RepID=A0A6P1Y4T4_9SPIR|nr:cation:dicarboxylase symporter family transporter [Treponema vincentii]QHX43932.1 dicarboxylate/amino acid:cation symporter [Treponema vincentii]